jgi:hypothetical protein
VQIAATTASAEVSSSIYIEASSIRT